MYDWILVAIFFLVTVIYPRFVEKYGNTVLGKLVLLGLIIHYAVAQNLKMAMIFTFFAINSLLISTNETFTTYCASSEKKKEGFESGMPVKKADILSVQDILHSKKSKDISPGIVDFGDVPKEEPEANDASITESFALF